VYQQRVVVRYVDGTEKRVSVTQWAMGQFAQWSARQGMSVDLGNPGLLGIVMLRYQAYCELHRDPSLPRPSFEKWDMTVSEVEPEGDDEPVDPTGTASGG
jgi:hypothetical protein